MSDPFKQEKVSYSNKKLSLGRGRISQIDDTTSQNRTSSLTSANSSGFCIAGAAPQELSAGLPLYHGKGFDFRSDMFQAQQLEASSGMKDFDANRGTSALSRDYFYQGENDQYQIFKDVQQISRQHKQIRQNQQLTKDQLSRFGGGYVDGGNNSHTEKSNTFGSHLSKPSFNNIKLGEIPDTTRNSLSSLPSKKKLTSKHKQHSFKDSSLHKQESLDLSKFENQDTNLEDRDISINYFYGENKHQINNEAMISNTAQDLYQGLIPERSQEEIKETTMIQRQEQSSTTHQNKKTQVKVLVFNNTPIKTRRARVYSDSDDPLLYGGSKRDKSLETQELQSKKPQHQQQQKHQQILNQNEIDDYNQLYTDQEEPYKRNNDMLSAGGVFPSANGGLNSKYRSTDLRKLSIGPTAEQQINLAAQLVHSYGKENEIQRVSLNQIMLQESNKTIEEDLQNEDSKVQSPNNEPLIIHSQEIVESQIIQNDVGQSLQFSKFKLEQIEEERKQNGYEEDGEQQSAYRLYDGDQSEFFGQDGDINDLMASCYESGLVKRIDFVQRSLQRTKYLNIMVCGPTGVGKTSFVQLFLKKFDFMKTKDLLNSKKTQGEPLEEFSIPSSSLLTQEYEIPKHANGQQIVLKLVDSAGYGDSISIKSWEHSMCNYLKSQLVKYDEEKTKIEMNVKDNLKKINRINSIKDTRIHLVLYFFGGHKAQVCDLLTVKRIQKYANVLPVIPQADSFKSQELLMMKMDIINESIDRHIKFFDCEEAIRAMLGDNTEMINLINSKLLNWTTKQTMNNKRSPKTHECPPFAIINPVDEKIIVNEKGEKFIQYGRSYYWGFCDAFSDEYSDFGRLYKLIINILWSQLVEVTDKAIMPDYIRKLQKKANKHQLQVKNESSKKFMLAGAIGGMGMISVAIAYIAKKASNT